MIADTFTKVDSMFEAVFNTHLNKRFLLLIAFSWALTSLAQSPAQYMHMGDLAAADGKWDEAFSYFEQGYERDTTSFDMAVRYADAARQIKYYTLAEKLYQKTHDKDNGLLNPDGLYWLARMQKNNGKYEDAQRNFKSYVKKFKAKGSRDLLKRAEQEAKSALWALDYKDKEKGEDIIRLSDDINTDYSETAPFIFGSDTLFYSSSKEKPNGKEWTSYYATINETSIAPIQVKNFAGLVANICIARNNMAFFSSSDKGITKLYTARYIDNAFQDITEISELNAEGNINTMPHFYETTDAAYLIFVSDRDGGEGGMDIWYARADKKSSNFPIQFEKPKTLGKIVNTEGDELTPFVHNNTFFFSSDYHNGFGGQDIFKCVMSGISLSNRENLGRPINSSANDFYYVENKKKAYLSSNRDGGSTQSNSTCCNDLYRMDFPQPEEDTLLADNKPYKTLKELNDALPVVLYFHNDEPNPRTMDTTTTVSYTDAYNSYLNLIPTYIKENTKGLSAQKREDAETITTDFFDLKVKKGKHDLEMFSDLLLKELQKGNSILVSVRGFASPRARTDYNLNLAKRRTESFVNFLEQDSAGIFLPYIKDEAANGAHIEFKLLPFGEYKADKSVSDDLADVQNSIYGRAAALERKIEIESATVIPNTKKQPKLGMSEDLHDFGKINKRETVYHTFYITNTGNAPMTIDSTVASCGCTEPKLDKTYLLPNEKAAMVVGYSPFGKKGKQEKSVMIYIAGEKPREVFIRAEVEE